MRGLTRLLATVCGVLLVVGGLFAVVYTVGANTARHAETIQGDTLGPQAGESEGEFGERAAASISNASAEPSFALVVFDEALGAEQASSAVEPAGRVNAVLLQGMPARATPEPAAGETRADVFAREGARMEAMMGTRADGITAVVVHAAEPELKEIAGRNHVEMLEVLPPDATWGAIGIAAVP